MPGHMWSPADTAGTNILTHTEAHTAVDPQRNMPAGTSEKE